MKILQAIFLIIIGGNTIMAGGYRPWIQEVPAVVTKYNATVAQCDSTPFITASGERVREGIIANNCLPFGSKVIIDGNSYVVKDRMNQRYNCDYFDIFSWNSKASRRFGRQLKIIKIIR